MRDQTAVLDWRGDLVPVSRRFDEPYYSTQDGLAETRHVFLDGNDLPARFSPGFHIAELGFGTGLNMLAAWASWRESGVAGALKFTSFEAFPMGKKDMATALAAFGELDEYTALFLENWRFGPATITLPGLELNIVPGDARLTLPEWQGRVQAWFLDGFSPARNPQLWQDDLMQEVARHTASGGTFATYTAAGQVRRALGAAGFSVEKRPGYGRKRHMTVGRIGSLP